MGISYDSLQIFGSNVYDDQKGNYQFIDINEFEGKIQEAYGIVLGEGLYEELLEEGVSEEEINFQEYASMYNHQSFHDYKVLMLIDYGNFIANVRDVAVGFIVDLNKEGMEKIAEKQEIFLQELEDFKAKTNLRVSVPKFDSLTYVL